MHCEWSTETICSANRSPIEITFICCSLSVEQCRLQCYIIHVTSMYSSTPTWINYHIEWAQYESTQPGNITMWTAMVGESIFFPNQHLRRTNTFWNLLNNDFPLFKKNREIEITAPFRDRTQNLSFTGHCINHCTTRASLLDRCLFRPIIFTDAEIKRMYTR